MPFQFPTSVDIKSINQQLDPILTGNPNNIVNVANPDTDCEDIDSMEGWSHKDYFEVKYGKEPHRIAPGQTRRFPAWLARHYAKHLADHILMKEMDRTKKQGLLQSPTLRPYVLSKILLSIDDYFDEPQVLTPAQQAVKEVEELNQPVNPIADVFGGGRGSAKELPESNVGVVPPTGLGTLVPEGPDLKEIMKNAGKEETDNPPQEQPQTNEKNPVWDSDQPKPTKAELLKQCYDLGIQVSGKEKVDDLILKVKKF